MAVPVRALISVVMLFGFYVLALGQLAAGVALAVWLASVTTSFLAAKLGLAVFLATVWAVGYGTWKALRTRRSTPPGLRLDRADAPELWATVEELAGVVGTRPPDEIHLLAEVNAGVEERSRLMGLVAGRRYLYVGMPLLQALSVAQLRAVLAHELGHYSGRHTRLAGVSYRGRLALERTVGHLGSTNVAGWVFRGYGRLYVRVHNAVGRRQELEADLASVRVAGRDAAGSALRELEVLAAAFQFYLARYVEPGLAADHAPEDLFGGFDEFLHARSDEIAELRTRPPADGQLSVWDTHPPLTSRLAAIAAAPDSPVPVDDRPARILVRDPDRVGRALQGRILRAGHLTVVPWDQLVGAGASAALQTEMDALLRAFSRAVNQPVPDVGAVLDHIAAGRLHDMAAPVFPTATRREARTLFAEPVATLLALAALRSGVARWEHSWTAPPRLVGSGGGELDLSGLAKLAVDPATVGEARRQLAGRGIDVSAARHVDQRVDPGRARVLGGIANMVVARKRTDVLVLSNGLLLVPGVPRLKMRTAKRRVARWVESGDPREVAAAEGNRFIPYEEIVDAPQTREALEKWELTLHGGEKLVVRWGGECEEVGDGLAVLGRALRSATAD